MSLTPDAAFAEAHAQAWKAYPRIHDSELRKSFVRGYVLADAAMDLAGDRLRAQVAALTRLVNAGAKLRAACGSAWCSICERRVPGAHSSDCAAIAYDRALAEARAKGAEVAG